MEDNQRMGSKTLLDDPGLPSMSGVLEISEDMAQALHRLLNPIWRPRDGSAMNLPTFLAARNAFWKWFREGRLRICREGTSDVLGVVEGYRLLRVESTGGPVRYAVEMRDGTQLFADDELERDGIEEMACHLKWHYLLFREPIYPDEEEEAEGEEHENSHEEDSAND